MVENFEQQIEKYSKMTAPVQRRKTSIIEDALFALKPLVERCKQVVREDWRWLLHDED